MALPPFCGQCTTMVEIVKIILLFCQANLEMSYSYQNRNVLFSGFRFYRSPSFISVNPKLETPSPGMI